MLTSRSSENVDETTPAGTGLVVVSFFLDVLCVLFFVVLGRRSHHEDGSFL